MKFIESVAGLEVLYDAPGGASISKVANVMTPGYRAWIDRAKFCILSTVGPEGTDATPRGDDGPVVLEIDPQTLAMPDWRGNNRIDSLRNIVRDGRVSLMFMVPGSNNVVRVNGTARITTDADMLQRFEKKGILPRCAILVRIDEIYLQCARALLRSGLWRDGDQAKGLPSPGQIVAAMTEGAEGGPEYDRAWPARAAKTMW